MIYSAVVRVVALLSVGLKPAKRSGGIAFHSSHLDLARTNNRFPQTHACSFLLQSQVWLLGTNTHAVSAFSNDEIKLLMNDEII